MRGRRPEGVGRTLWRRSGVKWIAVWPFPTSSNDPILRFNGGLFKERTALPLKPEHLGLLIEAAESSLARRRTGDLRHLPRTGSRSARAPQARRRVHARRWVERLVMPAVIEPLRERWNNVKATALAYGIAGNRDAAVKAVKDFHHELCHLRILDPACGSGNFLYVTMEHMKRLEGEVLDLLRTISASPQPPWSWNASPSTRTSFLALRSTRAPPRSQKSCSGSAICNGISDPRQRHARPARAQELPQHRVPRRDPRLRPRGAGARRARPARHPLGRPQHEDRPRHRP